MKCRVCNGSLNFQDGIYVCENCGSRQTVSAFFEKTEVFLCYIENDIQGRRSKDSVIAQDLYSKLENVQIHTFYQRISAADLTENDLETANIVAFDRAKAIVVIAATAKNFQMLIEKYGEKFAEKQVIPVYADMNANDIPKELKHVQAVNFNAIGAGVDFVKNILRILGKEHEVDIIATAKKHMSRKKRTVIISLCVLLALALAAASYVVLGTPYVLKSKKYEHAENLVSKGHLLEAVEIFYNLGDYQNSTNAIQDIYSKYNGYFTNEEKTLSIYLNLSANSTATIELMYINSDNDYEKASASAMITDNRIQFEFDSNLNHHGIGTVTLDDNGVFLQMTMPDNSIGCFFKFTDKSDAPVEPLITKEVLTEWLKTPVTLEDIKQQGYELIKTENDRITQIKDTDIFIHYEYLYVDDPSSDEVVFRISAPAQIIMPERIGSQFTACEENDYLYMAGYHMRWISGMNGLEDIPDETYSGILEENTQIILAYKQHAVFENSWNPYAEYYGRTYNELLFNLVGFETELVGENNNAYYAAKKSYETAWSPIQQRNIIVDNQMVVVIYEIDKSNFQKNKVYEADVKNVTMDNIDESLDAALDEYADKNGLILQKY